jgi:hypothetical protein
LKNGDLSNKVAPRIIVVFEGAVGKLPEKNVKEHEKLVSRKDWLRVPRLYDLDENILGRMMNLTWKHDINISLVTWMPDDAAIGISDLMDENSVPVRGCFSSAPVQLARLLPYNPDIVCVYDPVPEHILTFGSKGQVLTDASQIGRIF